MGLSFRMVNRGKQGSVRLRDRHASRGNRSLLYALTHLRVAEPLTSIQTWNSMDQVEGSSE